MITNNKRRNTGVFHRFNVHPRSHTHMHGKLPPLEKRTRERARKRTRERERTRRRTNSPAWRSGRTGWGTLNWPGVIILLSEKMADGMLRERAHWCGLPARECQRRGRQGREKGGRVTRKRRWSGRDGGGRRRDGGR